MVSDVRLFDRVFRIGGEEFAVILSGADAAAALSTAERLRHAVAAERVVVRGRELSATVSIGVAEAHENSDPMALVEAADAALYRAKKDGRNRVGVNTRTNDPGEPQAGDAS